MDSVSKTNTTGVNVINGGARLDERPQPTSGGMTELGCGGAGACVAVVPKRHTGEQRNQPRSK